MKQAQQKKAPGCTLTPSPIDLIAAPAVAFAIQNAAIMFPGISFGDCCTVFPVSTVGFVVRIVLIGKIVQLLPCMCLAGHSAFFRHRLLLSPQILARPCSYSFNRWRCCFNRWRCCGLFSSVLDDAKSNSRLPRVIFKPRTSVLTAKEQS